jgi:hypothetical protein
MSGKLTGALGWRDIMRAEQRRQRRRLILTALSALTLASVPILCFMAWWTA